jgi:hypothetical protein
MAGFLVGNVCEDQGVAQAGPNPTSLLPGAITLQRHLRIKSQAIQGLT